MINKFIIFHNNTDLPIVVGSWIDGSPIFKELKINPREKKIIHSSVGEWHLNSMLFDKEDYDIWKEKNMTKYINIGKFRSNPCASGNYSWLDYEDIFQCTYSEIDSNIDFSQYPESEGKIKGIIIFSLK